MPTVNAIAEQYVTEELGRDTCKVKEKLEATSGDALVLVESDGEMFAMLIVGDYVVDDCLTEIEFRREADARQHWMRA